MREQNGSDKNASGGIASEFDKYIPSDLKDKVTEQLDAAKEQMESMKEQFNQFRSEFSDVQDKSVEYVKSNPMIAIAGAVAAGFVAGVLLSSKRG